MLTYYPILPKKYEIMCGLFWIMILLSQVRWFSNDMMIYFINIWILTNKLQLNLNQNIKVSFTENISKNDIYKISPIWFGPQCGNDRTSYPRSHCFNVLQLLHRPIKGFGGQSRWAQVALEGHNQMWWCWIFHHEMAGVYYLNKTLLIRTITWKFTNWYQLNLLWGHNMARQSLYKFDSYNGMASWFQATAWTHWGPDKMVAISETTLSIAFS